jgi:hypothetical protein
MTKSESIIIYLPLSVEDTHHPSAQEIDVMFDQLINELEPRKGKPGPQPTRFERLRNVFTRLPTHQGFLTLPEIVAAEYDEITGGKQASSDISAFGKILDRWEEFKEYEVESVRITAYRIKRRRKSDS